MKKKFWMVAGAATCCALVLQSSAQAQNTPGQIAPFLGLGLTFGGEDLATAYYTSGNSQTVTTGGLVDLRVGLEYKLVGQPISIQGVVAYHVDNATATNGDLRFSRIPVELIAMYDLGNQWRLGVGMRKATGAKVTASGSATSAGFGSSTDFKSNLGFLATAEYMATPQVGVQARYVNETYTIQFPSSQPKVDGSHFGVFGVFYFR